MLIDSHAHLDDSRFDSDREAVLQRAWDAGIRRILTIGNGRGPDDMGCGLAISDAHGWIWTTVGIHPHDASRAEERHYVLLEQLASRDRVLAIGEMGLDYFYDNSPREVQREVFRRQLGIAQRLGMPAVVHTRDAEEDTETILSEIQPRRGVIHCFTGSARLADFAISLGLMISFSGIVTFPKARDVAEVARRIPADRILIETDSPYLAPVPYRGKRNEPAFLTATARFIADLRQVSCEELIEHASFNFDRLFAPESS